MEGDSTIVSKKLKWQLKHKQQQKYPTKRWGHTATILSGYLYIFGGKITRTRDPIYRFNCETFECEVVECQGQL